MFPNRLLALCLSLTFANEGRAANIDFERDIRPILAEHCYQCHGLDSDSREAGLRLDLRSEALAALPSGTNAIVPGNLAQSEAWNRVCSTDPSEVMPPPSTKKKLTEVEKKKIAEWIEAGATYADHWAFTTPRQVLPDPSARGADSNTIQAHRAIDLLVSDRLRSLGVQPSPTAPPHVLCRRLYLDLVGYPPSPQELSSFLDRYASDPNKTWNDCIDQLMANPAFGEKWAKPWLDVSRYADSNGYEKDLPRDQWAWRDWVIEALNSDMPYDDFIRAQIAGDLLAQQRDPTGKPRSLWEQQNLRIATGYLRNGMINEEGAIVPEEFRMEAMFDKLDCLGKSVLGLSLQCAQCHTHKFDPIEQREYYGLFAFFNNTYESQSWVYTRQQLEKIAAIDDGIQRVTQTVASDTTAMSKFDTWAQELLAKDKATEWRTIEAKDLHSSSELNHPVSLPDGSILTLGHKTVHGDVYMIAEPPMDGARAMRLEVLCHGDLPFEGPGRSFKGTWALTELIVERKLPGESKWEKIPLASATADYSEPEHKLEPEWDNNSHDKERKRICGPVSFLIDGKDETAWRADRGPGRRNSDSIAVVQFANPLEFPTGTQLKISLRTNHGGDDNGVKNVMVGRFRLALSRAENTGAGDIDYAAMLVLRKPRDQWTESEKRTVLIQWLSKQEDRKELQLELESLWKDYPEAATSVLHVAERRETDFRPTSRLDRGSWNQPREEIEPHAPKALHPWKQTESSRWALANWLVQPESTLVPRVAVNRVWQNLFGRGLLETSEDFGTRAEVPEYQSVLDWLSVDFQKNRWSHKHLIKQILLSKTYQQDSRLREDLQERDPNNRWLARGPRFRLDAEELRDLALASAGLLHNKVGGASTFPPVPESVLEYNYVKPAYWKPATGPERYRRSLYVFKKRSMPDPVLTTLDAPNGDTACARRPRSNTPLAALLTLNETVFVESARAMSLRILKEAGPSDVERIDYAYQLCMSRVANEKEKAAMLQWLASQRERIAEGWLSPREISTGDAKQLPALPPNATPQDAAVWTLAARVLLNLDEAISKN